MTKEYNKRWATPQKSQGGNKSRDHETKKANLLSIQIAGIKGHYKVLQTLWPIPRFEDAEEGDNILTGGIPNHNGGVVKSRKNSRFDELDNIGSGLKNEASVVFQQIACNRSYTIFLLRHLAQDIREICDILWCTRELVKFLISGQHPPSKI